MYNRLQSIIDGYYGFQKGRSAVDAIEVAFELARKAFGEGKYYTLVTLDIYEMEPYYRNDHHGTNYKLSVYFQCNSRQLPTAEST